MDDYDDGANQDEIIIELTNHELDTVLSIINDRPFLVKFVKNREFFTRLKLNNKDPK